MMNRKECSKMRKWMLIALMTLMMFSVTGCEEYFVGAGVGEVVTDTLTKQHAALVQRQAELTKRYEALELEIASAPDPNTMREAIAKIEPLREQMLTNEAGIIALDTTLKAIPAKSGGERNDAIVVGIASLAGLALREFSRRKLGAKYKAGKLGQARLKASNPAAESELYAYTGEERLKLNL